MSRRFSGWIPGQVAPPGLVGGFRLAQRSVDVSFSRMRQPQGIWNRLRIRPNMGTGLLDFVDTLAAVSAAVEAAAVEAKEELCVVRRPAPARRRRAGHGCRSCWWAELVRVAAYGRGRGARAARAAAATRTPPNTMQ